MKIYLDCIQCISRQALQAARFARADQEAQKRVVRRTLEILLDSDWNCSPMEMAAPVMEMVKEETGREDPYLDVKRASNRAAKQHLDHVMEKISKSDDPVKVALKAAIGGNIIDYGALSSFDLDATMDRVFSMEFAIDDEAKLVDDLAAADSIAYLGDNAGEIVFDRLLIETIAKVYGVKDVLFVVRDRPFLNDALAASAADAGLAGMDAVEVAAMPPRIPGPAEAAYPIWERIMSSDVVISKGQGNYEAFSSQAGIYFLLMAKCELVARDVNNRTGSSLELGDMILWRGDGS